METALSSLIIMIVVLFAAMTLAHTSLTTQDLLFVAEQEMRERMVDQSATELAVADATTLDAGATIEITLRNEGSVKLADYQDWDVIVEYYEESGTLNMAWFPYTDGLLSDNRWTVDAIYQNAAEMAPEGFEPDIWNPSEELSLRIQVQPTVGLTTTNRVTIGVANGASISTVVLR